MNRYVAVPTMIALLVVSLLVVEASAQHSPPPITDCTYLLVILEKAIGYVVMGLPEGEYIAYIMMGTPVAPTISDIHIKSYRALLSYYSIMKNTVDSNIVQKIYEFYQSIDLVAEYARKLQSCCQDPGSAYAIRARIDSYLKELKNNIENMLTWYSTRYEYVEVYLEDKVYEPGETIPIYVKILNKTCSPKSAVLTYINTVFNAEEFICIESICNAVLRAPPAYSVKDYIGSGIAKFNLVVKISCLDGDIRVYRFVNVEYLYPQVVIDVPTAVLRGDTVNVTLYSEGEAVNGVLMAKNSVNVSVIANATIGSTPSKFKLLVEKPYFIPGINILKLCVNATEKTLPQCFEKPIIVKPRYPKVEARVLPLHISWDGGVQLVVTNHGDRPLKVRVYANNRLTALTEIAPLNTISLYVYRSLLPLSLGDIAVYVEDSLMLYDTYIYTSSFTVLNLSITIAIIVGGLATTILLREYEKMFTLYLAVGGAFRRARGVVEAVPDIVKDLLKPYVLGLGSSIAQLYYSLVKRFTRLPLYNETLREHYRAAVLSVIKSMRGKGLLWRLLLLAEKDMYSREKPRFEEAKKLYESVVVAEKGT